MPKFWAHSSIAKTLGEFRERGHGFIAALQRIDACATSGITPIGTLLD